MNPDGAPRPRARFTFRGNLNGTRHGWLRLTPAYSVHFVRELLDGADPTRGPVLDPFCGTGTTLLACAERGLDCTTVELNPFLVWLASAKTARYSTGALSDATALVGEMGTAARAGKGAPFVPAIHRIERWWSAPTLAALGRAATVLHGAARTTPRAALDLARVAFCRALIDVANVSFGHQSMSFRVAAEPRGRTDARRVERALASAFDAVLEGARFAPGRGKRTVIHGDSRAVDALVGPARFGTVVTSPPYSNRMSYIRELRPYMYWLGHLKERRDAGELDWHAIGGTWGAATSRLATWRADDAVDVPHPGFRRIVAEISRTEPLLGAYVHRYFEDMARHVAALARIVNPGGRIHYVVGNSKFYDVMLPAEELFVTLFEASGFTGATITTLRKRTSKRELFEYLVEATMPAPARRRARAHAVRAPDLTAQAAATSMPNAATPRRRSSRRTSSRVP